MKFNFLTRDKTISLLGDNISVALHLVKIVVVNHQPAICSHSIYFMLRGMLVTSSEEITVIHHHIGAEEEWWWCWHLSKSMQIWSLNSINCNVGASVNSNFSRLVTRLARLIYCWLGWAGCCAFNLPVRLVTSWVRGGKIIAKENNGNWIMLRRRLLYTNSLSQLIIIQEERNVQKEEQFNFKSTQYVDTRHPPYWRK